MWDDVIIGKGDRGCSAIRVFAIEGEHSISENSVSYWVSDLYLNMGMVIFKSTEEGRQLAQFVSNKGHIDTIKPWLDNLALQNIDRELLKERINHAVERSFQDGSNARVRVICEALGIAHLV